MKRVSRVLACALALAAAPALAAINPSSPGLPQNWSMEAGTGYFSANGQGYGTQTGLNGNPSSAMCVECHSVNPSPHVLAPAERSSYYPFDFTTNQLVDPRGTNGQNFWGTHAVMNVLATGATDPWGVTNSGGGFSGGFGTQPRDNGEYMRKDAWDTDGQTGFGESKYNVGTTALQDDIASNITSWADADMICESCHNILVNVANPNYNTTNIVNKLLLAEYDDNTDDTLCVGCHGAGTGNAGATYADFHANDNLANFDKSARKRHHVLTGDTLSSTNYDPDNNPATNDSIMWAPSFSDKLDASWCSTPYAAITPGITLADGTTVKFRGACNVSGVGTRSSSNTAGDIVNVDANTINCSNCHRPHNAMTQSGAFIFRTGNGGDYPGQAGTSGTTLNTSDMDYGIRRQSDVGDWTTTKIYGEYQNLCDGCHQGYSQ